MVMMKGGNWRNECYFQLLKLLPPPAPNTAVDGGARTWREARSAGGVDRCRRLHDVGPDDDQRLTGSFVLLAAAAPGLSKVAADALDRMHLIARIDRLTGRSAELTLLQLYSVLHS